MIFLFLKENFTLLKMDVTRVCFPLALSVVFLIYYRQMHVDNRLNIFKQLTANGDKLVFSLVPKKKARAEAKAAEEAAECDCE